MTNTSAGEKTETAIAAGMPAAAFELPGAGRAKVALDAAKVEGHVLLAFFETSCPTCQLTMPYLQKLAAALAKTESRVIGVSQNGPGATEIFMRQTGVQFAVALDEQLAVSRQYNPDSVPTLYLIDSEFMVTRVAVGFSKDELNAIAAEMTLSAGLDPLTIAPDHDGAPARKPGCESRHREPEIVDAAEQEPPPAVIYVKHGPRATQHRMPDDADLYEFMRELGIDDPLPVVPPTVERVERMLAAIKLDPEEVVAMVPPNYGMATVEKIAANAVMAGCAPEMMRVLPTLIRAVCDERFNIHGIQATTHFAAPLVIVNGPIRNELGFWSRGNVFSNIARANSTLGRALQLILTNIGGARPGEIDMSTLGNPGKFSYCIAENEEQSPWEPFHIEHGFRADQSTVTLFAAEPPTGVSEHNARDGKQILRAISAALRNVWTFRSCMMVEAFVVICPEHAATLKKDGFTKRQVRDFLFENTGVPVKAMEGAEGAEGTQFAGFYNKVTIDGEPHYRKFRDPESIRVIVAGGTAGKFSAVIGSWVSGPRGSQSVTYPIE